MPQAQSTRWCPTQEQLMILEELYRGGLRTPDAPQIQKITVRLSCYGRIEGKNVFYWFQNHKARERQKLRKRLITMHHHHHLIHLRSPATTAAAAAAASRFNPNCRVFFRGHDQPHDPPFFNQDATQGLNLLRKLETQGEEELTNSSEAHGFVQQYCTNPCFSPPKTLDLFPTKSTFGFQSKAIDQ